MAKPKKKKSKKIVPTSLDNYTQIRGKEIGPSLRDLIPKKSELVTRQGTLLVDKDVLEDLFKAIDELRKGAQIERDAKGRFKKREELGMDALLKELRNDPHLTQNQRIKAATSQILRRTLDQPQARSVQSRLKSSGALRNQAWYEMEYFVNQGKVDIDLLTDEQADMLSRAIIDGTVDITNLSGEALEALEERLSGPGGIEEDEEKREITGGFQPKPSMRARELDAIEREIRRLV